MGFWLTCVSRRPPAEVVETTTAAPPADQECRLVCDGVDEADREGCRECGPERWWNGTGCIANPALCPCVYNGRP